MKPDRRRHDLATLRGNRVWVVTVGGTKLIQKLYGERRALLQVLLKRALNALRGNKSSPAAAQRHRVEREMLAHWSHCGFAVPADRSDEFPALAGTRTAVLEFVEAPPLGDVIADADLVGAPRRDLLRRFAIDWGARHARALADDDPTLVHEHGSVEHALVEPARFVTIDLERRYTPGTDVFPLVAREIAGTLRSLAKRSRPERLAADFDSVIDGYPDRVLLRATVRHYLEPRGALRRWLTRLDRGRERRGRSKCGKFAAVEALDAALLRAEASDPGQVRPTPRTPPAVTTRS